MLNLKPHFALALLLVACSSSASDSFPDGSNVVVAPDTTGPGAATDTVTPVDPTPDTAAEPDTATITEPDTVTVPDTVPVVDTQASSDIQATADTEANPGEDTQAPVEADSTPAPSDVSPPGEEDIEEQVPVEEVRFVALGDVGEGNENQYEVAAAIEAKCATDGCDFAILLGDNVYDAGVSSIVDNQWEEKFELPYANLDFPFYAVLGNHDNGGLFSDVFGDTFDGAGGEFDKGDIQVAYTDVSTKWTMPDRVYDFVSGPAHFFALDTNDMMWAEYFPEAEDRANAQMNELPGKLDASPSPWKIVMGHHPYVSNGAHGNAGEYEGLDEDVMDLATDIPFVGDLLDGIGEIVLGEGVKEGIEAIVCNRADLYMSGHDHNRQWLSKKIQCPGVQFVVSGAGAKTKELGGSNPTEFEDASIGGFLYVHIAGPTLNAQFIDQNGVVNFSTTIEK